MKQAHVNLEETPAKVAGGRRAPVDTLAITPAQTIRSSKAWAKLGGLRVRRGVYRFRTHEEADQWLWQKLTSQNR